MYVIHGKRQLKKNGEKERVNPTDSSSSSGAKINRVYGIDLISGCNGSDKSFQR